MPLRRLAALVFAVCLCSAAAIIVILRLPSGHDSTARTTLQRRAHAQGSPFAYITERELVLMRGTKALARVPRVFEESDPAQNKVVWADDGRHVALLKDVALLHEPPSAEELMTVDAQTGSVRHIPCPRCYDLTPVGSDSILAATNASDNSAKLKFLDFNLDSGSPGVPVNLNLPAGGQFVRSFLASTRKYVLTSQGTYVGAGYEQQLEWTKIGGKTQANLGDFDSNDYMHAAVAENANDTSSSIAVAFVPDPGVCIAEAPIVVFGSDGSMYDTDMSEAEPRGYTPGVNEGLEVNDLWWGSDGHFHATIASWTCDNSKRAENDKQVLASPSSPWRLDGRTWVKEGTGPATMMRQLDNNIRVALTIPGCIGPKVHPNPIIHCNTGKLYRYQGRKRTIIASKVISISAPSPEGVPHALPAAIPVLGQLARRLHPRSGLREDPAIRDIQRWRPYGPRHACQLEIMGRPPRSRDWHKRARRTGPDC